MATMNESEAAETSPLSFRQAVPRLLSEFAWNPWFLNQYWPENEPRVRLITEFVAEYLPQKNARKALEAGCGNGYIAYLFSLMGFEVNTVDAYDDDRRTELFNKSHISFHKTNLNDVNPLSEFPDESFDLVVLGEVFEHILNNPAGLLRSVFRVLRPGGVLVLTTPNPSTAMNAIRVLRDGYILWGTDTFLKEVKFGNGIAIDNGDIHYKEYPAWIVKRVLEETGFKVPKIKYVPAGSAPVHAVGKRITRRIMGWMGLLQMRLFCMGYVMCAIKPNGSR